MIRHERLEHRFVRYVPQDLERGVLYISIEFATSVHSCCCGCGEKVVAPFGPTDWKMTFDGESVSLHPSIGNWMLECRSHYFIEHDRVIEARPWSDDEVRAELRRDRASKARVYGSSPAVAPIVPAATPETTSIWRRALKWLHFDP